MPQDGATTTDTADTVKFIRKRKLTSKRPSTRQEQDRDNDNDNNDDDSSSIVKPNAKRTAGLTVASAPASASSSSAAAQLASTVPAPSAGQQKDARFSFKASGTAASLVTNTATRTLDVDGILDSEGRLIQSADPVILAGDDAAGIETYKGASAYKEYVNKKVAKVTQSNAGGLRAGPLKGQTTVRITSRFDYQQDICKDYKDSGNCGFGDSCIYMHDRGDYKTGWQLEKEWEEQQKLKQKQEDVDRFLIKDGEGNGESDEDDVPTECPICNGQFKDPVVTKCKHYFCEACALKNYAKSKKCFECDSPTDGSFMNAKDLKTKLAEKKAKIAAREEEIRKRVQEQMNGVDGSDDGGASDDDE
ncbi:hypothetical protein HDU84_008865 [Entophlyctis sp. JEL0112]|nr:hypothetical protein HDU84_008865 [Entophlyctis sp. JEL0112]